MSGRQKWRAVCAADGCTESAWWDEMTVEERQDLAKRLARDPWRCTRHSQPEAVLGLGNRRRAVTFTAERSKRFPELTKLFWREDGRDDVGSGFMFGPGFKAFADDFPEGTRIVVTAAVQPTTPTPTEPPSGGDGGETT